ncbi:unnamed protein product [Rhodiola kirilowii]
MKGLNTFLGGIWWDDSSGVFRWRYSSNGLFSVSSAYDVIIAKAINGREVIGEQSDMTKIHILWKKIWSCKVPSKIKVMCWWLFHNSLPDAVNLRKRGISLDYCRCKLCGFGEETDLHVVRDCWWTQALWRECGMCLSLSDFKVDNPAEWMWYCAFHCSGEDLRALLTVIWACWKNRNLVWHDKEEWSNWKASIICRNMLKVSGVYCPNPLENAVLCGRMSPPDPRVIKINTDGSWRIVSRRASIGVIARDHLGIVLWVWADMVNHCFCSSEVEGIALLHSMKLAARHNAKKVIFEVDSLEVYKAVSLGFGVAEWCCSWLPSAMELLHQFAGWSVNLLLESPTYWRIGWQIKRLSNPGSGITWMLYLLVFLWH